LLKILALVTGTDDDLPPSYQNSRGMKGSGRMTGNGRDTIAAGPYTKLQPQTDMESQIHELEQEAYCSVLRAFKAQSDAITWVHVSAFMLLIYSAWPTFHRVTL
jgi:hypothetical protein